eukprot:jgi/Astpho2/9087/Aster-x0383
MCVCVLLSLRSTVFCPALQAVLLCRAKGAAVLSVKAMGLANSQAVLSCKAKGAAEVDSHTSDLTSASAIDQLVSTLVQRHQKVDVLVNNAGKSPGKPGPTNGTAFSLMC